jgi:Eco57I restriction-modification methylase
MLTRLKFKIDHVIDAWLDRFPQSVWTDPTLTFVDPAMGGGQLIAAVEKKLLSMGHSRDNVASRVFGWENNSLSVNYAVRSKKLIGTYGNRVEALDMKFNVVISNPPYTSNHESKRWTQWVKQIDWAWDELTFDDSWVAMITPSSWLSPGPLFNRFKNHCIFADLDPPAGLPTGSTFSFWIMSKTKQTNTMDIVCQTITHPVPRDSTWLPRILSQESISINRKTMVNLPTFAFKRTTEYHTSKPDVLADKNEAKYKVFHSLAQVLSCDRLAPHYDAMKVMISLSGYPVPLVDEKIGCSQAVAYLEIDANQAENASVLFNSKLYQYLLRNNKWSGWNSLDVIKSLPAVSLEKKWSNAKLYAYFKLSDDEVKFIETFK